MIFGEELVRKIRAGDKTQTRRLAVGRQELVCNQRIGQDYAVQPGRGKKAVCRIRVTTIRREQLKRITPADAKLEGFDGRLEFAGYWLRLHDRKLSATAHKLTDDQVLDAFETRHGDKPVWVITFELVIYEQHRPRPGAPLLLAPGGGYTSDPHRTIDSGQVSVRTPDMSRLDDLEPERLDELARQRNIDPAGMERHQILARLGDSIPSYRRVPEPEAVPPSEIGTYTGDLEARQTRAKDEAERQAAFDALPLSDQIALLQDSPRAALISNDLKVIRQRVDAARRKLDRREAA